MSYYDSQSGDYGSSYADPYSGYAGYDPQAGWGDEGTNDPYAGQSTDGQGTGQEYLDASNYADPYAGYDPYSGYAGYDPYAGWGDEGASDPYAGQNQSTNGQGTATDYAYVGNDLYSQSPDGQWNGYGTNSHTFTDQDFKNYQASHAAIGSGETPGYGGTVGGVSIPPGLKAPGAGYSNGPNQVPYAPAGDKVNWAELIKGLPAALAGAQFVSQASREPYKAKTPTELRAMLPSNTPAAGGALANAWKVGANAPTVRADAQATSLVPSTRKYADGGEVQGPLSMVPPPGPSGPMQAFSGAVQGDDGGQSDLVDAQLSAGEYVIDAESVSMLGDGNTEAGIKKLDELRLSLRAHKRSVPDEQIAPPSEGPLSYIQGAA